MNTKWIVLHDASFGGDDLWPIAYFDTVDDAKIEIKAKHPEQDISFFSERDYFIGLIVGKPGISWAIVEVPYTDIGQR